MNSNVDIILISDASEDHWLKLSEFCALSELEAEQVEHLIGEGFLEPASAQPEWRFTPGSLARTRRLLRLRQDLELDWSGAVLAVELLEQMEQLRRRLRELELTLAGRG
jgi:chaperone modulatory protein CbpM